MELTCGAPPVYSPSDFGPASNGFCSPLMILLAIGSSQN